MWWLMAQLSHQGGKEHSLSLCRVLKAICSPLGGLFKVKSHERSKTLTRPLVSPHPALLHQEEKLAHQAGSDVILQMLPDSPTQRPELRAVKVWAWNNICVSWRKEGATGSQPGGRSQALHTHTGRKRASESTSLASFSSSVKWTWVWASSVG